jgi:integrase
VANIRKITHRPRRDGSTKTSWRATWSGADGARQSKNFERKGEAQAWLNEVGAGRVGGSSIMTLVELAEQHIRHFDGLVKIGQRQAITRDGYQSVLDVHLAPHALGRVRLSNLRAPQVQGLLDDVLASSGSVNLARRVRRSLVTWCRFGIRKGWLLTNPAEACKVEGGKRVERDQDEEFAIPEKTVLGRLLSAAGEGDTPLRDAAIVRLLMFGGLRISEVLGLADDAAQVKPKGGKVRIRERLDRHYRTLDPPKSKKGTREVPIGEATSLAIRAWRLSRGPVSPFDHVDGRRQKVRAAGRLFPHPESGQGVWSYNEFFRECWLPMMRRAGLVDMLPDSKGKNRPVPAFGPHTLRHVAASLWIEQDVKPKKLQELLGHATLQLTMDLYGHLWTDPAGDDAIAQASERMIAGA